MKRFVTCACLGALLLAGYATSGIAQTDRAVINQAGIAVKLITTRDCQLYADPDQSSSSAPCRVFTYWYVLPPDPMAPSRKQKDLSSLTQNGFYRVSAGDNEAEFKGWIHESDAVQWHHRQAVNFASRQHRGLAHFFPDEESAKTAATSGTVSGATHREPETTAGNLVLMPLLDSKDIKTNGQDMELYRVAFMAARPDRPLTDPSVGSSTGTDDQLTVGRVLGTTTVDIVFLLDTTESMKNPIGQVLKSIEQVAKNLASKQELGERYRFGLVAYRDIIPDMSPSGLEYLTRVFCTLEEGQNHKLFLERLRSVKVAHVGSGDYPEDVLAGLDCAMNFDEMGWNPTAWKLIVIVGDSSIKGSDHPDREYQRNDKGRTIAGMKAKAQSGTRQQEALLKAFVISAVRIEDPNFTEDHAIALKQYYDLAHGRQYVGDLIKSRGGKNPEDFSERLTEAINNGVESFGNFLNTGGEVKGTPTDPTQVSAAQFPLPLVDLIATLPEDPGGTDLGMNFADRYCTEYDADGNRMFVPHVFVRKGQLESFNYVLAFLQAELEDAGDPGKKDVANIVKNLQVISTSLNLAEPITADMPLEKFLRVLLGLPLKTPIFFVTIQDLGAMSQADYNDWVKDVKACAEILEQLIENPNIWHKLHPTAKDREYHAFVALADLP